MASIPVSRRKMFAAIAAVTVSFIVGVPTSAFAEKCTGMWGGQNHTTIEFKGGKNVRYCFIARCWNTTFTGSKDSKLEFALGSARVWLTKTGNKRYKARYRRGSDKSVATYRC